MNRKFLLALALLLGALVVLLFVFDLGSTSSPGDPESDDPREAVRRPALLDAPEGGSGVLLRGQSDVPVDEGRGHDEASALYVIGTLRLPDGRVVPDALVGVMPRDGKSHSALRDTKTDVAGRFRIATDHDGEHAIVGHAVLDRTRWFAQAKCQAGEDVELVLASMGPVIVVRVVDPDGNPVPSAQAALVTGRISDEVRVVDGVATFSSRLLATPPLRHAPSAAVPADSEPLTIHVWDASTKDGRALPLAAQSVETNLDEAQRDLTITLLGESVIAGTVRNQRGEPLAGLRVVAQDFLIPARSGGDWRNRIADAQTDSKGRYRLGRLAAKPYDIDVSGLDAYVRPDALKAVAPNESFDIVLEEGVSVTVRVVDWLGEPVEDAYVSISEQVSTSTQRTASKGRASGRADKQGNVSLAGLRSDARYRLHAGHSSRSDTRSFSQSDWSARDEVVQLARGYVVAGIVVDLDGNPIERASVRIEMKNISGGRETSKDGRFLFGGLPSGKAKLMIAVTNNEVHRPATPQRGKTLKIESGRDDLRVVLDPGGDAEIRFSNWPKSHGGTHVRVFSEHTDPDGTAAWVHYGSGDVDDGILHLRRLPRDRKYLLLVGPVAGWWARVDDVRAGTTRTVALSAGGTIRGRITGVTPLESIRVKANMDGFRESVKTTSDGRFEFAGLPPGLWTVKARTHVDDETYSASVEARPGASIELALKPPVRFHGRRRSK